MITLCAWRESGWFWCRGCGGGTQNTEDNIWKNLALAYGAEVVAVPHSRYGVPDDLVGEVVVLDENGEVSLEDFVWPTGDVVIVTGRTAHDLSHIKGVHVMVPVPDTGVFGVCIAAIALEDRRRKAGG